jgi:hypothetical protein
MLGSPANLRRRAVVERLYDLITVLLGRPG